MKIEQNRWTAKEGWQPGTFGQIGNVQLVLVFGSGPILGDKSIMDKLHAAYPQAHFLGCSTAGEILGTEVRDDSLVATAISFKSATIKGVRVKIGEVKDSYEAGAKLAGAIDQVGLRHLFVLSDGLKVNGSELVKGLVANLPDNVHITGGLSGDGANFKETFVFLDEAPATGVIAALGLYGNDLLVGYGSFGGWDPFGPSRIITKSKGNVLYELDGKSALELYKQYLGEQAKGLPASGLLFPLEVRLQEGEPALVRSIAAVDEKEQSLTFFGDVPEGARAQLMKANFDRLVDGSASAAKASQDSLGGFKADLAILISCVGRKVVLAQRTEEEVDAVREVLGEQTALTGFYSYGEIAPFSVNGKGEFHNQTMTITALGEK